MNNQIITMIESNKMTEALHLFRMKINKPDEMFSIILEAFKNNKDDVGKKIINFKFAMRNRGFQYDFAPFDFFCYVCQNEHMDILFRIIEDEYFWKKDTVIFESDIYQTPKQWLIATAGYIYCSLNKILALELICDKYNITTFDAIQSMYFDVARSNNYKELLEYLIDRYQQYTKIKKINNDKNDKNDINHLNNLDNNIYESSLYNINKTYYNYNYNDITAIENPMYNINN